MIKRTMILPTSILRILERIYQHTSIPLIVGVALRVAVLVPPHATLAASGSLGKTFIKSSS